MDTTNRHPDANTGDAAPNEAVGDQPKETYSEDQHAGLKDHKQSVTFRLAEHLLKKMDRTHCPSLASVYSLSFAGLDPSHIKPYQSAGSPHPKPTELSRGLTCHARCDGHSASTRDPHLTNHTKHKLTPPNHRADSFVRQPGDPVVTERADTRKSPPSPSFSPSQGNHPH